jgi:hypothetical protein
VKDRSGSPHLWAVIICVVVAVLLPTPSAQAIPIGDFSWDDDPFGLFGPSFRVTNFSSDLPGFSGSFLDVFVDLDTDLGLQEIAILFDDGLPIIPAGAGAQSTDDLGALTINGASLRLIFEHGPVVVADLTPDVRSTIIDFAPPPDSTLVPEPSTIGMVAIGLFTLWTLGIGRRARGH